MLAALVIHVCADVTFGASSTMARALLDGVTAVGVPARVLPTAKLLSFRLFLA